MDTKSKIIEGSAELFRKYGIKSVTMDIIATNLGISKRTIYEYFSDKDELLIGVFEYMSKKQKEVVTQIMHESENIINAIFRLIRITLDYFYTMSPGFIEDIKKVHRELIIKKKIKFEIPDFKNNQQLIDRGIKEKLFRRNNLMPT
ncbi:MAG: TetR/AcrR family transcriptional regulator [Bacteroidales bacterium]|nr:TetR/AcrR family transcriptional regulator [Bacteroidales bacterium]